MPENAVNGHELAEGRPFPWICPKCRKREVRSATIPYHTDRLYQGHMVNVVIPSLHVPKCDNCGELVFNYSADEQILEAVKAQAAEAAVKLTIS